MKKMLSIAFAWLSFNSLSAQNTSVQNIEPRLEALLAKMTLDEKIGQLNQVAGDISTGTEVRSDGLLAQIRAGKVGSVLSHTNFDNKTAIQQVAVRESRLGIPILFGFDVIHGYKTIFPIPLAQAATWNLAAIERAERIAAAEAAADGQHWTFSPMVDITHDPRWGRVMEGAGEDPWYGSLVAQARIRSFQGDDLSAVNTLAACAKHFAGYGFTEGGREYNTVDMSEQRLRQLVLPPFEAAVQAGCATFMNAFNTLNGVPASMNKHLVSDILRGEWGFRGLVVSDWNSFGETIIHGAAADDVDASAKCLSAGSDMDMAGGTFQRGLQKALAQGRVTNSKLMKPCAACCASNSPWACSTTLSATSTPTGVRKPWKNPNTARPRAKWPQKVWCCSKTTAACYPSIPRALFAKSLSSDPMSTASATKTT
ncbi:MAG: hypothetical protein IPH12_21705 [Saprospirales bacterium]|nr:hypothetical protein [Saprospirales bacterium]